MSKNKDTWKRLVIGKTSLQIAELVISDLVGYRKTSLKRAEDTDNVTAMIEALRDVLE